MVVEVGRQQNSSITRYGRKMHLQHIEISVLIKVKDGSEERQAAEQQHYQV